MSGSSPVSPLLDGLIMGEPISEHHGVRCCPALREDTDERYMVKIVSIPASQNQLDALLLTGAFANELKAQEYFAELADAVTQEAELLDRLSRTEGFLPYQGTQIVKMQDGVGFEVYLLAPYRDTLEEQMRQSPLTHRAAVDLGLDLCAAMAASRRAGYLYLDLKPSNIFATEDRGYCIGDLGTIRLSSLPYASFPEKYRCVYTAPEIQDAMSPLNGTLDIYALGLTLYQVYNNGQLPIVTPQVDQPVPPPLYADYEMAAIILKACAALPEDRWQSPAEMGQALVGYMQRNEVSDTSIIPPPVELLTVTDEPEEFLTEEENDAEFAQLLAMIPDEDPPADEAPPAAEEVPAEEVAAEEEPAEPEDAPAEPPGPETDQEDPLGEEDPPPEELDAEEGPPPDDERTEDGVTNEVAQMLAQADVLIEHELPEPVVAPDPIEVPIPPPIIPEPEPEPVPEQERVPEVIEDPPDPVEDDPPPDVGPPEPEDIEETEDMPENTSKKKIDTRLVIRIAAIALLLVAIGAFGFYYYNNIYTQTIDSLSITGVDDQIIVRVDTKADSSKLTVVCTDAYGNTTQSSLTSGVALFNGMKPDTQYKIEVTISGSHKLVGQTTGTYTTGSQSKIVNFTVTNGAEDGSVILSFNVMGPDSQRWTVEYAAPNIPAKTATFEGHSVELSGLTVGVVYTFRLTPEDDLYLTGEHQTQYTVTGTILAQGLTISAYYTDLVSVTWTAPDGVTGTNWIVRCYNDAGYDQTGETTGLSWIFSGIDSTTDHTITVTAQGMTQSVSISTEGLTPTETPDQGNDAPQDPDQGIDDPQDPDQGTDDPQDPGQNENDPQDPGQNDNDTQDPGNTQDPDQSEDPQDPDQGSTQDPDQGDEKPQDPDQNGDEPAEAVVITGFKGSTSIAPWNMELSWSYTGQKPSGWIVTYTTNGGEPVVMKCSENYINIIVSPEDVYVFEVRPADDVEYSCEPWTYTAQKGYYTGNGFDPYTASFSLTTEDSSPVTSFSPDAQIYFCAASDNVDTTVSEMINVTFVIRNANGDIISAQSESIPWNEMWADGICKLLIPQLPTASGDYAIDLFFNYFYVTCLDFQII